MKNTDDSGNSQGALSCTPLSGVIMMINNNNYKKTSSSEASLEKCSVSDHCQDLQDYLRSTRWSAIPSNGNPNFSTTVAGISFKSPSPQRPLHGKSLSSCSLASAREPVWKVPDDFRQEEVTASHEDDLDPGDHDMTPAASVYDVETEHAYIMDKALRSYEEHTQLQQPTQRYLPKRERAKSASCVYPHVPSKAPRAHSVVHLVASQKATVESKPPPTPINLLASPGFLINARPPTPVLINTSAKTSTTPGCLPGKKLTARPSSSLALRLQKRSHKLRRAASVSLSANGNGVAKEAVDAIGEVGQANAAVAEGRGRGRQPLSASRVQVGTSPSMDQIGYPAEAPTKVEGPKKNFDGTFFVSTKSPRRAFYTIHPEWISENLSCQKLTLKERTSTFPPRRCKSAPPTTRATSSSRTRNPITWENWNVKPHR